MFQVGKQKPVRLQVIHGNFAECLFVERREVGDSAAESQTFQYTVEHMRIFRKARADNYFFDILLDAELFKIVDGAEHAMFRQSSTHFNRLVCDVACQLIATRKAIALGHDAQQRFAIGANNDESSAIGAEPTAHDQSERHRDGQIDGGCQAEQLSARQ